LIDWLIDWLIYSFAHLFIAFMFRLFIALFHITHRASCPWFVTYSSLHVPFCIFFLFSNILHLTATSVSTSSLQWKPSQIVTTSKAHGGRRVAHGKNNKEKLLLLQREVPKEFHKGCKAMNHLIQRTQELSKCVICAISLVISSDDCSLCAYTWVTLRFENAEQCKPLQI